MGINVAERCVVNDEWEQPLSCLCAEGLAKQERRRRVPSLARFRDAFPTNHVALLALHFHFQNEQASSSFTVSQSIQAGCNFAMQWSANI